MLTRIAHNLRRRIKPHRLTVQQTAGKGRRIMALHPTRHIDQLGKTRRMALGKSVIPEPLDLVETPRGEFLVIAALGHPPNHLLLEQLNRPTRSKRRHRLAQLIRLLGREPRRINRDLHRLFLKNRHAKCAPQNPQQLILRMLGTGRGIRHPLQPLPAPQIRMHHIPLNGARPHNRHFNHQIVKLARPQLGQHRHLRTAFHLKHPQTVACTEHVISIRIIARHTRQIMPHPVMCPHQIKHLCDAGQHPQRQNIHFENPQRVDVVLIPLDEGPLRHRPIPDGHHLRQGSLGQNKPAHMLGQMPWHPRHLPRNGNDAAQIGIAEVHPCILDARVAHLPLEAPPNHAGQFAGHILAQPHRLAHFADGTARTVMDHSRAQPRTLPPVGAIHVLDHFLAPLMLEIHVNIRRLVPLLRQKPLEQNVMLLRVHRSNPQTKTHN